MLYCERIIIYIILLYLIITTFRLSKKKNIEHLANGAIDNPNMEAISNLSNFVNTYHNEIQDLVGAFGDGQSLQYPTIIADASLTTKGGTNNLLFQL